MNREEALNRFNAEAAEMIEIMDGGFWKDLFENRVAFLCSFEEAILDLSERKAGRDIRYLYCYMLRSDIHFKKFRIYLRATGSEYILDDDYIETFIDVEEYFHGLWQCFLLMEKGSIKYAGKVSMWDIFYIISERALDNFKKMGFLLRFLIRRRHLSIESLIDENHPRIIRWGEYRDKGELLYFRDEKPVGREGFKELLKTTFSYPYAMQVRNYGPGEYEGITALKKHFEYAVFENIRFINFSFEASSLWGSCFKECSFIKCSFKNADLSLAIFLDCSFKENIFDGATVSGTYFSGKIPVKKGSLEGAINKIEDITNEVFLCGTGQESAKYREYRGI